MTVIPAQAGIQRFSGLVKKLDPRFHEDDDFCKSFGLYRIHFASISLLQEAVYRAGKDDFSQNLQIEQYFNIELF